MRHNRRKTLMQDTILKKTITVSSIESGEKKTVVKDQDGKKFNVWHTKKNGEPSVASKSLQQLQVKPGSVVEVSYTEEEFITTEGTTAKSKRVLSFAPVNAAAQPDISVGRDIHGEILGTSGILQAMITGGHLNGQVVGDQQIREALRITRLVRSIVSESPSARVVSDDAEISVDDIPF